MEFLHDLKKQLCKELEEIGRKPQKNMADYEMLFKISGSAKNVMRLMEGSGMGGYSQGGAWHADIRGGYGDGNSFGHYVRGHYSNDGGMSNGGYSQNGYSQNGYSQNGYSQDGNQKMEMLDRMIQEAKSEPEKDVIRRFKSELQRFA